MFRLFRSCESSGASTSLRQYDPGQQDSSQRELPAQPPVRRGRFERVTSPKVWLRPDCFIGLPAKGAFDFLLAALAVLFRKLLIPEPAGLVKLSLRCLNVELTARVSPVTGGATFAPIMRAALAAARDVSISGTPAAGAVGRVLAACFFFPPALGPFCRFAGHIRGNRRRWMHWEYRSHLLERPREPGQHSFLLWA